MTAKLSSKRPTAGSKPRKHVVVAGTKPVRRARPLAKRVQEHSLEAFNQRLRAKLKAVATAAKGDEAFELFVRTALNGDTGAVTGWADRPVKGKGKAKKAAPSEKPAAQI